MTITIIIAICILLLIAYTFDLTTAKTKIPSVILLLIFGWGIRQLSELFEIKIPDLVPLLPLFGTLGLVLIVLEGALDLEMNKSKFTLVKKTVISAVISMFVLAFAFAFSLHYYYDFPFKIALVNVIPLCVISSSVAIASAGNLAGNTKEFIIYESSLSDILGVLFFNFIALNEMITLHSFGEFGLQLVIMFVISLIATIGLSFLLSRIDHPTKYAPIIILMILIYALSEIYHLPALIFILFFGLFLGNIGELRKIKIFNIKSKNDLVLEVDKFRDIVREGAFLIKAFFFTLFGYSFHTEEIINHDTLALAFIVTASIFVVRFLILYFTRIPIFPLLYISPRGLITILLFFAIPGFQAISLVNKSLIIQVIIITSVIMMIGMMVTKKPKEQEQKLVDEQLASGSKSKQDKVFE
ncbi:MAG: cation:proton antiporter [Ginsengibacter sp.]